MNLSIITLTIIIILLICLIALLFYAIFIQDQERILYEKRLKGRIKQKNIEIDTLKKENFALKEKFGIVEPN